MKVAYLISRGLITESLTLRLGRKVVNLSHKFRALDLFISSDGGDLSAGLAICNLVRSVNTKVRTICFGTAHSVASLILACGDRGHRKAMIGSKISLHRTVNGCFGNVEDIIQQSTSAASFEETVTQIYMEVCDKKLTEVTSAMLEALMLNGNEARS